VLRVTNALPVDVARECKASAERVDGALPSS
jgi:hypothetical protein